MIRIYCDFNNGIDETRFSLSFASRSFRGGLRGTKVQWQAGGPKAYKTANLGIGIWRSTG
jgi:hypothetical protein